jgi:hypothetical protein
MQLCDCCSLRARRINKFDGDPETESVREIVARIDSKLFVYVLEMTLDGPNREVHMVSDLAVGAARSRLEGRFQLKRGQARMIYSISEFRDRRFDESHPSMARRGLTRSRCHCCRYHCAGHYFDDLHRLGSTISFAPRSSTLMLAPPGQGVMATSRRLRLGQAGITKFQLAAIPSTHRCHYGPGLCPPGSLLGVLPIELIPGWVISLQRFDSLEVAIPGAQRTRGNNHR